MSAPPKTRAEGENSCPHAPRRELLRAALGLAVASLALRTGAATDTAAERLPPQVGDQLAFPSWEEDGRLLRAADVHAGAAPVLVYPRDPVSGITRERSRLNQVLVLRIDEATASEATRAHAAAGVVAYSGICTHAACGVSEWNGQSGHVLCPCHSSEFDPANGAVVVSGPATRALPALPLRLDGDSLVVAGAFTDAPGAPAAT